MNVKINCKTESNFFYYVQHKTVTFSMVGRIWIRDGPRVENRWSGGIITEK